MNSIPAVRHASISSVRIGRDAFDVLDAAQDRIGASHADVRRPGAMRMRLLVVHVRQHAGPQLVEHAQFRIRHGVAVLPKRDPDHARRQAGALPGPRSVGEL